MMEFSDRALVNLIQTVVVETLKQLDVGSATTKKEVVEPEMNVIKKTETILENYTAMQSVVRDKTKEIDELRNFGVQHTVDAVHTVPNGGNNECGLRTNDETVDSAVGTVQASVKFTVQVLSMVDNCMVELVSDPYYGVLEMLYFDGKSQEEVAQYYGVTQPAISHHKKRLIRQLAMRMFPDEFVKELLENKNAN